MKLTEGLSKGFPLEGELSAKLTEEVSGAISAKSSALIGKATRLGALCQSDGTQPSPRRALRDTRCGSEKFVRRSGGRFDSSP